MRMGQLEDDFRNHMREEDRYHHARVKGNIHNLVVLYGMETVSMTSSHVKKLEVKEMKICRWASGHPLRDHVRKYDIWE